MIVQVSRRAKWQLIMHFMALFSSLYAGVESISNSTGSFNANCMHIGCKLRRKYALNKGVLIPETYIMCNQVPNKTLRETICTAPEQNPKKWLQDIDVETYFYDFQYERQNTERCLLNTSTIGQSSELFCGSNLTCCLSSKFAVLFGKTPCRMDYRCKNVSSYRSKKKKDLAWARLSIKVMIPCFFVLGSVAMIGNVAVIIRCLYSFVKRTSRYSKEVKAYSILLLNLACADLLMGVYVLAVGITGLNYLVSSQMVWDDTPEEADVEMQRWISNVACNALGNINFLSSQVSITALVTITGLRLHSSLFPYRRIKLKLVVAIAVATWFFWLIISCIPLMDFETVKTIFVDAIDINHIEGFHKIRYFHLNFVVNFFLQTINGYCGFSRPNGYTLKGWPSWEVLLNLSEKLALIKSEDVNSLNYLSYYNERRVCTPKYLVHHYNTSLGFTLTIIVFNAASFSFIFLSQIVIARKSSSIPNDSDTSTSFWERFFGSLNQAKNPMQQRREEENRRMRRRMFFIVATDFCCWIPISLISIAYWITTIELKVCEFVPYREQTEQWFFAFSLFVIPINSSINPFIYSYSTWKNLKQKFKCCCRKPLGDARQQSVGTISNGNIELSTHTSDMQ